MKTVIAISDLHGNLVRPDSIPECDLLLIGGDICPYHDHNPLLQLSWLSTNFSGWVDKLRAKEVVVVAGNHDLVFERMPQVIAGAKKNWPFVYLQDEAYISRETGLSIWGCPWQLRFHDWAFNADPLGRIYERIPKGIDVFLLHGPPHMYGDGAPRIITDRNEEQWPGVEHVGSPELTKKILTDRPKLVIYGHIHEGYGKYHVGDSLLLNSALVDGRYRPTNKPWEIDYDGNCMAVRLHRSGTSWGSDDID